MSNPRDYKHIYAWGMMMSSSRDYIHDEQVRAAADNAPLDAIYKRQDGWRTMRDVTVFNTIETMKRELARLEEK